MNSDRYPDTKLLILLEFSPISCLPKTLKKAKIQTTLSQMLHRFFFSRKSAKLKLRISSKGTRLRGGLYWKG